MKTNANDITVLGLLAVAPLHPYEMARRMHEWQIERFTGSRRSALYHAVGRLQRAGLIEELERGREGARPERTTYAITAEGREALFAQLRDMLATPEAALPRLAAGLTFVARLEPEDAAALLERRAEGLREEVSALTAAQDGISPDLPRIYYIELEYALTIRRAELDWVEGVVADVRDGRLTWTTTLEDPA